MARCGCAGGTCSCVVQGSGSIAVTGSGTAANPYVVSGGGKVTVADTATVDLTLTGAGTQASPYLLSAAATVTLDALTDVSTAGATTGQVLAKKGDGSWGPQAAPTAAPGVIVVSGGIEGDGSAGNPLSVKLAPNSGLTETASGLAVSGGAGATAYTPLLEAEQSGAISIGNGTIVGEYVELGKLVEFGIEIEIGSTTQRGSGYWMLSLPTPVGVNSLGIFHFQLSAVGSGDYTGLARIESGKLMRLQINAGAKATAMSSGFPTYLGAGSILSGFGHYIRS